MLKASFFFNGSRLREFTTATITLLFSRRTADKSCVGKKYMYSVYIAVAHTQRRQFITCAQQLIRETSGAWVIQIYISNVSWSARSLYCHCCRFQLTASQRNLVTELQFYLVFRFLCTPGERERVRGKGGGGTWIYSRSSGANQVENDAFIGFSRPRNHAQYIASGRGLLV